MLGVFGDPALTGKPAGDDLREGKRTVLIAVARERLSASARRLLDELLGDGELTDSQVDLLQNTIEQSGALAELERLIEENMRRALEAIDGAPLSRSAKDELAQLAETVIRRTA